MILSEMFTGELIDEKFLDYVTVYLGDKYPTRLSPCRGELGS